MIDCGCPEHHSTKQIVLTGGPGAGKTAVRERELDVRKASSTITAFAFSTSSRTPIAP